MVGAAGEVVGVGTMVADEMVIGIGTETLGGLVAHQVQAPAERGVTEMMIDTTAVVDPTPRAAADRPLRRCPCLPQET